MTAEDVVYSIKRWIDPETKAPVKWRVGDVDKVTAMDDYTVEYKLKEPFSELLYQMTQYFHPSSTSSRSKQLGADFGVKGFNGTGPFCMESWTPRDQTVLTRHAAYKWGPSDLSDNASRQGRPRDLEGRAGGEHARHRAADRPGRRQPVRALLGRCRT